FWITLEQKALGRKAFWLPLIVLALFAGVRSYRVGTDSGGYVSSFTTHLDVEYFKFDETVELGYQLLEYTLLTLTSNYFWLFFITSLIIVYCYLRVIKKYSVNYWYSVFLFMTLGTYTFFFNGLRQGLAMAIFTLAIPYLLEKKLIPYLLVCFFASLFHISALFLIPFYFIVNLRIRPIYKILITLLVSLSISSFLVSYLASTNKRYESYTEASEQAGGLLTLGFYVALILFIFFIDYIYKIKEEKFNKLFVFYASGVAVIIPLALLGTNPSGPQRLLAYFTWTLVLILPIALKKINNTYVYIISIILAITYFVLTTSKFSDLTPYIINPIFEIF
uniref:EpsG family protein n=1 Tax=Psychrobacter frigidicola TaxID=45611 RepID=UPI001918C5DE